MKMLILAVFVFGIYSHAICQTTIYPFSLEICCNRTTNLIFPYPVKSVDRGSRAILVQKASGAANVLQVKAATANFTPTSLSVITGDGKLYSFNVSYDQDPGSMNISFEAVADSARTFTLDNIELSSGRVNDLIMKQDEETVLHQGRFLHVSTACDGIQLSLRGIFIKDGLLWFVLDIINRSFLNFRVSYTRCFIRDRRKAARTAVQETELPVLFPDSCSLTVPGKKRLSFTLALAPFSFLNSKKMIIQLSGPEGAGTITLAINHKKILRARLAGRQ